MKKICFNYLKSKHVLIVTKNDNAVHTESKHISCYPSLWFLCKIFNTQSYKQCVSIYGSITSTTSNKLFSKSIFDHILTYDTSHPIKLEIVCKHFNDFQENEKEIFKNYLNADDNPKNDHIIINKSKLQLPVVSADKIQYLLNIISMILLHRILRDVLHHMYTLFMLILINNGIL